jgi:hypothetical protein
MLYAIYNYRTNIGLKNFRHNVLTFFKIKGRGFFCRKAFYGGVHQSELRKY